MTVAELYAKMSTAELIEWQAHWNLEAKDDEERMKALEAKEQN